ncbi:MAG: hypothetical protein ABFD07_19105 [Methanobacterium sp.]
MTENMIEKLNALGITDVTDLIQFYIYIDDDLEKILYLFKSNGWTPTYISQGLISIVSVTRPSEEFIAELKSLGAQKIKETLQVTVDNIDDAKKVHGVLDGGKWDKYTMGRPIINTVVGEMPAGVWNFKAERCYYENER